MFVRNGKEGGSATSNGPKTNPTGARGTRSEPEEKRSRPRDRGFTQLMYQELMDRKQKGLCYKCGGPFHLLYQCPDKQLRVIVLDDEDDDGGDGQLLAVEVADSEEISDGEMRVMTFKGLDVENHDRPRTVKLVGRILGAQWSDSQLHFPAIGD